MFIFWLVIVCMLLVALVMVLPPLLGRHARHSVDATSAKVDIYRNRLQEMDAEVSSGVLSGADAEAARTELARTLLQETDTDSSDQVERTSFASRHWWAAGIIAVLVPVIAVLLYLRLGTPEFAGGMSAAHGGGAAGNAAHMASIETMVKRLAERLEQNPDDPEGWTMLVNSYMTLGRYPEALGAVEHLHQIVGDRPEVLVRYADVLATVNGGNLSGRPSELLQQALALEPENKIGLWLAGMAAAQAGNPAAAIEYWQRLLPLLEGDPSSTEEVSQLIAQARARTGAGSEQIAVTTPATGTAGSGNGALTIKVSLSPNLAQVPGEQSLFVVAKAENGPPMPLAVIRKTAADLPLEVKMDDANSMMPSLKLSTFARVVLSARISPSGNAIPQPGDLVSSTSTVKPGQDEPVTLVIDRKLP